MIERKRTTGLLLGLGVLALVAAGWPCGPDMALAGELNDTGITKFGDGSSNSLATEPAGYPGQDASFGRDAAARAGTLAKVGGGSAGFDFTKLDPSGNALPASAGSWSCVRDNVTGLIWEIKTDDNGPRDKDWTYSWYNSTGVNDGGSAGSAANGSCGGTIAAGCNTEKYVVAVNSAGLCGAGDWRLPSIDELQSIVDSSRPYPGPTIDTAYFPETISSHYWSSSPYAYLSDGAWIVHFSHGAVDGDGKDGGYYVRLVRGGQ